MYYSIHTVHGAFGFHPPSNRIGSTVLVPTPLNTKVYAWSKTQPSGRPAQNFRQTMGDHTEAVLGQPPTDFSHSFGPSAFYLNQRGIEEGCVPLEY